MEGERVIEFYRLWLLRVLSGLFVLAGMVPGGAPVARLPKSVRLLILRAFLPAESATRRLALYMARRMQLVAAAARSKGARTSRKGGAKKKRGSRSPVFWLFDRQKYFPELSDPQRRFVRGAGPNIRFFDERDAVREPVCEKPKPDPDDGLRLCRRMQALLSALEDMQGTARRLLRAMERRKNAPPGSVRYGPMRPGFPPGYRKNRTQDVDEILYECHAMAWRNCPPPET